MSSSIGGSSSNNHKQNEGPRLIFTSSTFKQDTTPIEPQAVGGHGGDRKGRLSHRRTPGKHIQLDEPSLAKRAALSSASSVYLGSYKNHHHRRSRSSVRSGNITPETSVPQSPRFSITQDRLSPLLQNLDLDLETYDLEETRDGFFDAAFHKPWKTGHEDPLYMSEYTLPAAFKKNHPNPAAVPEIVKTAPSI